MIHFDGPRHARARDRAKAFVRQVQQSWPVPEIEDLAAQMLTALPPGQVFDGVRLATDFIDRQWCRLLRLPEPEMGRLVSETEAFLADWGRVAVLSQYKDRDRRAAQLMRDVLAGGGEGGCPWHGDGHLDAPVMLVILAVANGTVKQMIGNILHLLATDPAEQDRLRRDPARLAPFVEEALRLQGAVRYRERIAGPEGLPDFGIPPGAQIRLWLDSAGRDARVYADPQRFDPDRHRAAIRPAPVLTFGGGPHLCVGRLLARVQIHALIGAMLGRFRLTVAETAPRPFTEPAFRGFHELPLRLRPV